MPIETILRYSTENLNLSYSFQYYSDGFSFTTWNTLCSASRIKKINKKTYCADKRRCTHSYTSSLLLAPLYPFSLLFACPHPSSPLLTYPSLFTPFIIPSFCLNFPLLFRQNNTNAGQCLMTDFVPSTQCENRNYNQTVWFNLKAKRACNKQHKQYSQ